MALKQNYGRAIWTNHALNRLRGRSISQDEAWLAFQHPDRSHPGKQRGTIEYQKTVGSSLITVVAMQNEKKEWLILSCWKDPAFNGQRRPEKKGGFWSLLKYIWEKIF